MGEISLQPSGQKQTKIKSLIRSPVQRHYCQIYRRNIMDHWNVTQTSCLMRQCGLKHEKQLGTHTHTHTSGLNVNALVLTDWTEGDFYPHKTAGFPIMREIKDRTEKQERKTISVMYPLDLISFNCIFKLHVCGNLTLHI